MEFLIQDLSSPSGYRTQREPLTRGRGQTNYVPWAVTPDGRRVVYAVHGAHRSRPNRGGLRAYDTATSKERRRNAESALGMLALNNQGVSLPAIRKVSDGLRDYYDRCSRQDPDKVIDTVHAMAKYFYSDASFGRLGTAAQMPGSSRVEKVRFYWKMLDLLKSGKVSEVLNLQDQLGRLGVRYLGGPEKKKWNDLNETLRPAYMFDSKNRGRSDRETSDPTYQQTITATGGTLPHDTLGAPQTYQAHERGVDRFSQSADSTTNQYYYQLDHRNLTFGAGPSGTTGTLLTTGIVFGALSGEILKQYLFGIIGYLIGGGMHSTHESFTVAALCPGINYTLGSFTQMLPENLKAMMAYKDWWAEYYDIAELGGTHWMHGTADPSQAFHVPHQAT